MDMNGINKIVDNLKSDMLRSEENLKEEILRDMKEIKDDFATFHKEEFIPLVKKVDKLLIKIYLMVGGFAVFNSIALWIIFKFLAT